MELHKDFVLHIKYNEGTVNVVVDALSHPNFAIQMCLTSNGPKEVIKIDKFKACLAMITVSISLGAFKEFKHN